MTPWGKLKKLEIEITDLIARECEPTADSISALRRHFSECSTLPDAEEAICFHGAKSLLAQIDGDYDTAILHREVEAQKIDRIYELEEENPTEGWTLQNLQRCDVKQRAKILEHLRQSRSEHDADAKRD